MMMPAEYWDQDEPDTPDHAGFDAMDGLDDADRL